MAHFPALRPLLNDMRERPSDREHFEVRYANVLFDLVISINNNNTEILIGGQGTNWSSVMQIRGDIEFSMPNEDYFALLRILDLHHGGDEPFNSYLFLRYIATHAPRECSGHMVNPVVIHRYLQHFDIEPCFTALCRKQTVGKLIILIKLEIILVIKLLIIVNETTFLHNGLLRSKQNSCIYA